MQGHAFANWSSRHWRLLKEEEEHLCGYPSDQQKAAGRYSQHDERPEMMILRLSAQWAFFFHGWRVALEIIAIGEGKLLEI
jgi:hypothetical protein